MLNLKDRKTLHDVMLDYRSGILGNSSGNKGFEKFPPGCVLCCALDGSETYSPGDLVALQVFTIDRQSLSGEEYKDELLYGISDLCFKIVPFSSFEWETENTFEVVRFGAAKDFIDDENWGWVQVSGFVWAPVDVPFPFEPETQTHAILRKNSRYDGKPFLQAAPDGNAEIVRFGNQDLADGRKWALLNLNTTYKGTLFRPKVESGYAQKDFRDKYQVFEFRNIDEKQEECSKIPNIYRVLESSTDLEKHKMGILIDDYSETYDNFVRMKPIENFADTLPCKYFYLDESSGFEAVSVSPSQTQDSTRYPDFELVETGKAVDFSGGDFEVSVFRDSDGLYVRLFGVKTYINSYMTDLRNSDVWEGDQILVRIDTTKTPGSSESMKILACATDFPVGTVMPIYLSSQNSAAFPYARGWRPFSVIESDAEVTALSHHVSNVSVSRAAHTHSINIDGSTYTTLASEAAVEFNGVGMQFVRKQFSGWTGT